MDKHHYTIGIDFGTLSARAVVADVTDGTVVCQSSFSYPHGVITERLPETDVVLPEHFCLAAVDDYREALWQTVREAAKEAAAKGIGKEQIVGIGIDATSSTFLPVDAGGVPLCKAFPDRPHAFMKLWKHHHAQAAADDLTGIAKGRHEVFLERTGGKINAEWMLPKLLEIFREDREIFDAAHYFMEIGDYVAYLLTGVFTASRGPLGYKLLHSEEDPSITPAFLSAVEEGFEGVFAKIYGTDGEDAEPERKVVSLGECAGFLLKEVAEELGLPAGIPVAAANIDAHVAFPTLGIMDEHAMLMILGTSCCTILIDRDSRPVEGVFGIVKDGVLPGFYGYESGQSAVGDVLSFFVGHMVPAAYQEEAEQRGLSIHELLTEKAENIRPGGTGLLVMDWFNGNRSVLVDTGLSGVILGLTLETKPEEIYRALIEALAFGIREIIDSYEQAGIPVRELYATGGIARKNALFMQIYADVTGKKIHIAKAPEGSALGSAIFAAACAGKERGGHPDLASAIRTMGHTEPYVYEPDDGNHVVYDRLYAEYNRLHDYFGRGENDVMKTLMTMKETALVR